jgi:hypothetical protein
MDVQGTAFDDEIVRPDLEIKFLLDQFGFSGLDSRASLGDVEHGRRQALVPALGNSRCLKCRPPAEMAPVLGIFYHKYGSLFLSCELRKLGRSGLHSADNGFGRVFSCRHCEERRSARLSQH